MQNIDYFTTSVNSGGNVFLDLLFIPSLHTIAVISDDAVSIIKVPDNINDIIDAYDYWWEHSDDTEMISLSSEVDLDKWDPPTLEGMEFVNEIDYKVNDVVQFNITNRFGEVFTFEIKGNVNESTC